MSFQRYLLGGAAAIAIVGGMVAGAHAQETSAVIRGVVTGPSGEAAAGVTVVVTHVPSGTTTTVKTNGAGVFVASGLRVGGPYTVELTSSAYQGQKIENVFTSLGQTAEVDVAMKAPEAAQEIVVTASRNTQGIKTGPRTVITAEQIEKSPSIGNDPKDFARRNPFVTIDPSNFDSFNVASQRGRANSLTVDNVRLNDDFGLNSSGYPTLRPPISEEAIASVAVNVAPYSVEYNKFTGGNLNVVTKSGTNDFHGSAFYEYSNDYFRNDYIRHTRVRQPFTEDTWGGSLGGPIWPDRAFLFLDYQRYIAEKPFPSGPSDGSAPLQVDNITQANVDQIAGLESSLLGFNYDTQHPLSANAPIQENAINSLAKFDVNIMPGQRLVMTYQQIHNGLPTDGLGSFSNRLDLASDFYTAGDRVEAENYQLFSDWTDNFSTEITYSHKHVKQIQDALAGNQTATGAGDNPDFLGEVIVAYPKGGVDAAGNKLNGPSTTGSDSSLTFGTDTSRQANQLQNSVDYWKAKAIYTLGRHSFMGGYEREDYQARNLFLQASEGVFTFSNTTDLGVAK
ncbi:MAG: TonB-dependent receptor, partial [Alphaproteobacteria bacterium]